MPNTNPSPNLIAARISELKGSLSQAAFAQKLHTTQSNISKILSGVTLPSLETLLQLATSYSVSIDWLLGLSETKNRIPATQEDLTYADVLLFIHKLFTHNSIAVDPLSPNPTANEPPPLQLIIKDLAICYMIEKYLKIADPAFSYRDTWLHETTAKFSALPVLKWRDMPSSSSASQTTAHASSLTTDTSVIQYIKKNRPLS